jgi:hypothetical protein
VSFVPDPESVLAEFSPLRARPIPFPLEEGGMLKTTKRAEYDRLFETSRRVEVRWMEDVRQRYWQFIQCGRIIRLRKTESRMEQMRRKEREIILRRNRQSRSKLSSRVVRRASHHTISEDYICAPRVGDRLQSHTLFYIIEPPLGNDPYRAKYSITFLPRLHPGSARSFRSSGPSINTFFD